MGFRGDGVWDAYPHRAEPLPTCRRAGGRRRCAKGRIFESRFAEGRRGMRN
nr:MAG TPA: hypothetical protein [Caudoviricetes sp.]